MCKLCTCLLWTRHSQSKCVIHHHMIMYDHIHDPVERKYQHVTRSSCYQEVGAAAAPSVVAPSCDASHTDGAAVAATLTRPPQHGVRCVRLVVLVWSTPCWSSESEHKPKSRRSTTETQTSLRFGMQQHYLDCYVNTPPGGLSTPWKCGGRLVQGCFFQMVPLV